MESDSDEQLLGRSSREPQQFAVLWDRHRDRVYRHLVFVTRDAFEAEDLTASTFLELWRRRGSVRFVDGSALPWLLVTANNLSRNAKRAIRRHRALLAKLPPPSAQTHPADDTRSDDDRIRVVAEVMREAKVDDRNLLILSAIEGFTIREAALIVGLSESAAKMRLHRLKARITTAMSTDSLSAIAR